MIKNFIQAVTPAYISTRSLFVNSTSECLGKTNGLLSLHAPNLEPFVFVAGQAACCQGARAVADTRVRLPRLKAFRWDDSTSSEFSYCHYAQLDGL